MKHPWVYMCSPSRSPLPLPPGFPSAPGPSACLMHPTWAIRNTLKVRFFLSEMLARQGWGKDLVTSQPSHTAPWFPVIWWPPLSPFLASLPPATSAVSPLPSSWESLSQSLGRDFWAMPQPESGSVYQQKAMSTQWEFWLLPPAPNNPATGLSSPSPPSQSPPSVPPPASQKEHPDSALHPHGYLQAFTG